MQSGGLGGICDGMQTARRPLLLAALGLAAGRIIPEAHALSADTGASRRLALRLARLEEDGLDPRHYAIPEAGALTDPAARAALHQAAAQALNDLLAGRARELRDRPDVVRDLAGIGLDRWQAELAGSAEPAEVIERAANLHPDTPALKAELLRARAIAARGWESIPGERTIEPGSTDATRVPALRARLAAEDPVLAAAPDEGAVYGPHLLAAVRRWQEANGLEVDGRVGRISIGFLNRPASARVDQIRVAMDMRRGAMAETAERRIEVNVPDFRLSVTEEGREILGMAVIVGRPDRATPLLRVRMTAIQFNPPWGVPERNAREDLLPRFRRDPQAMRERGFRLFQVVGGERIEVDPTTVDWSAMSRTNFPYFVRQDAGDANALGRIKFIMPNGDDIFMHDTPDRHLFRRPDRAFSSGCIRLDRPAEMMALLLDGTPGWDLARAQRAIESRVTSAVTIRRPLPVLLSYRTVMVEQGRVRIRPDLYRLDAAYARAMDQAPRAQVAALGVAR